MLVQGEFDGVTRAQNVLRLEIAILKDDLVSGVYTSVPRRFLLEIQSELIEKERILKLLNSGIFNSETNRILRLQDLEENRLLRLAESKSA